MEAICEKIRNNYYNNTQTKYPDKKEYKSIKVCDCCSVEKETYDKTGYEAHMKKYHEEKGKLHDEFIKDCFEYYGITNHPCRDIIYSKAWEDGHSSGYSEVFNCMDDIIEFVEKIEKTLREYDRNQ